MNIKKAVLWMNNSIGLSKVEIAKKLDTNVKMIDSILCNADDTYIFAKAVRANGAITKGMRTSDGKVIE